MFVKAFLITIYDIIDFWIFDSERFELGVWYNGWVHDCDCLFQLQLISKLIMEVHAAQEHVELRVGVNPAQGYQIVLYLCLEQTNFVGHVA